MESITDTYISEIMEESSHIFSRLGVIKAGGKILVFLSSTFEATAAEIMTGTGVSHKRTYSALGRLVRRKFVTARKPRKRILGKKQKVYRLSKPIADILRDIEIEKTNELRGNIARLEMLCTLINN
jgi:predicted transcriptional regulator